MFQNPAVTPHPNPSPNKTLHSLMFDTDTKASGARFLKVLKLFGRISGDNVLFVSSKRRHLKARNFAVILIFLPFKTYEKTSFTG